VSTSLNFQQKGIEDFGADDEDLLFLIANTGNGLTSWTLDQLIHFVDDVIVIKQIAVQDDKNFWLYANFGFTSLLYVVVTLLFKYRHEKENWFYSHFYGFKEHECKIMQMRIGEGVNQFFTAMEMGVAGGDVLNGELLQEFFSD
jgi:hypothetical protein